MFILLIYLFVICNKYTFGAGTITGYNGTETISIAAINLTNLRIPLLFEKEGTGRGIS